MHSRKVRRADATIMKEKEKLETRKLVMKYTLKIEKEKGKMKEANDYPDENARDDYSDDFNRKERDNVIFNGQPGFTRY